MQHPRHAHFLLQNARILKFIKHEGSDWVLTKNGLDFLEANEDKREEILVESMLESKIVSCTISEVGTLEDAAKMTCEQLSMLLMSNTLLEEGSSKGIHRSTAVRRAASLRKWLRWLSQKTLRISDDFDDALITGERETLEL
jgi:hypothetical protein